MATPARGMTGFQLDQFWAKRKLFAFMGKTFFIYDMQNQLVGYVHQKAFKLKEDIRVYSDEGKTKEVLSIKARKILDVSSAYDVVDSITQQKVGVLKRKGLMSAFLRDQWVIMDANDKDIGRVEEDSMLLATIRRHVFALVPQSFNFFVENQQVGEAKQNWNFFAPRLAVNFSQDPSKKLDRRLALAGIILLMSIEGRQS